MAARSGPSPRNGLLVITPAATAALQIVERQVTVFFMVDRREGLAEALRQSTEASAEAFLPALGLFCIAAAVGLSGCLVLPAAGLLTAPMGMCILAAAYRDMCPAEGTTEQAEPDGSDVPS